MVLKSSPAIDEGLNCKYCSRPATTLPNKVSAVKASVFISNEILCFILCRFILKCNSSLVFSVSKLFVQLSMSQHGGGVSKTFF